MDGLEGVDGEVVVSVDGKVMVGVDVLEGVVGVEEVKCVRKIGAYAREREGYVREGGCVREREKCMSFDLVIRHHLPSV